MAREGRRTTFVPVGFSGHDDHANVVVISFDYISSTGFYPWTLVKYWCFAWESPKGSLSLRRNWVLVTSIGAGCKIWRLLTTVYTSEHFCVNQENPEECGISGYLACRLSGNVVHSQCGVIYSWSTAEPLVSPCDAMEKIDWWEESIWQSSYSGIRVCSGTSHLFQDKTNSGIRDLSGNNVLVLGWRICSGIDHLSWNRWLVLE
jgi:hypothetical protein